MIFGTLVILMTALSALLPQRVRKIELVISLIGALAFLFVIPSGGADSPAGIWAAAGCLAIAGAAGTVIAASYLRRRFVSGNAHG
jgi:TRAP-type C4-dicarboxylate transport system permease small subunit